MDPKSSHSASTVGSAQGQSTTLSPEIQNVVSLAKVSATNLDLFTISQKAESARYVPKRFPAVVMRKTDPRSTVSLNIFINLADPGVQIRQDDHHWRQEREARQEISGVVGQGPGQTAAYQGSAHPGVQGHQHRRQC